MCIRDSATIETPAVPITLIDNDTVVETPKLFVDDILIDEKQGTAQFVVRLGRTCLLYTSRCV